MLAFVLLVPGCSKKGTSPTNPAYGGGGGGGSGNVPFDSGSLGASATYDRTFPTAGSVGYHCTFHRAMGMVGTVVVAGGGAASASVSTSGSSFSPASVTIAPGGTVHWTITSGTHTVTSD